MGKLFGKYFETDKAFYKALLVTALPVILQSLITTGVNMVDTIMLGQLTESVLSASSQANQFIGLFTFAMMGIAMGASVLCSRFWGAKDILSLKKVITIALRFGLGLAAVFTILDVCFPRFIMSLYIEDEAVIENGRLYLLWSASTFILMALSLSTTNILRSVGLNQVPLIASVSAFAINIGANYMFIFGKWGAPEMGIAGAALGTVIARVVETGIMLFCFFVKDKRVGYRIRDFFMKCGDLVGEFIKISVPVMLSDSLLGVGENMLAIIMGRIGPSFVSANAITMVVQRISTIFVTGLSFSGCFLIGKTLGERRVKAAKKQGNTFLFLGILMGLVAAGVIFLIAGPVIETYKITAETKQLAYQLMYAICFIIVFRSANSVLTKGVIRGGGDTRFLLIADISTMWILAIPLGALAGLVWHMSAFWIYIFLHFDQIVKAIWCVIRMKSGKWIKKVKGIEFIEED